MSQTSLTSEDLRAKGLAVLEASLGAEDTQRFLRENGAATRDYTAEHHRITDAWSLDDIFRGIEEMESEAAVREGAQVQ